MKIYVAATFAERERIRLMRDKLFQLGHDVISSWLNEVRKGDFLTSKEFKRKLAIKDIVEVHSANLLIQDTIQASGGKNNELGLALGQFHNKLVWTVGPITNIFQELADHQFDNWEDLLEYIGKFYKVLGGSDANKLESTKL